MQARIVGEVVNYVMEVGFVPEPPQLYGIAALVAGESHVHWLQCNAMTQEISHGIHFIL